MTRTWNQSALTIPGIGVALLPKLICPFCWPLYAGIVSSFGLGFLVGTAYLIPITCTFLILALVVLGLRAKQRQGYGPFFAGFVASVAIVVGKFVLELNPIMYIGVSLLVAASVWNAWPRRSNRAACPRCAPHTIARTGRALQREV